MTIYQVRGYPSTHYFVKHAEWSSMTWWLMQNNVEYLQESSSQHGIGFSIRKNKEWFLLRWANDCLST